MTTSKPTKQPVLNGQDEARSQPGAVEEFVRLLDCLAADKGCHMITNMVSELKALRARNDVLEKEVDARSNVETRVLKEIQNVMNESQEANDRCSEKEAELEKTCEELEKAQQEIHDLKMELEANKDSINKTMANNKQKEAEIGRLKESLTQAQRSAKQSKQDLQVAQEEGTKIKKQYETASKSLASFSQRFLTLRIASEDEMAEHVGQLRNLFEEAHRLVQGIFGQLQIQNKSTVGSSWQKLIKLDCLAKIPLPPGNSETARQMRVAAVLRLLAETACEYIYHPVYLTEDGIEVADIIGQLGSPQAEWMRSLLLNTETKRQADNGAERATIAANELFELVGFLLIDSPTAAQDFKIAVYQWYQKACKIWMPLQQLELRIRAQFVAQGNGAGPLGWKLLPQPSQADRAPKDGAPNGVKPKPATKNQLVKEDIATEVWPEFLATTSDGRSFLLVSGYALDKAQTLAAKQELEAASLEPAGSSRRAAHGRQRLERTVMGGPNGSLEKLSFLSQS
ncbi:hypothetical protein diail_12331 [Diaporthe ilicicola]|nr:hypothetical protein diail_12331 [Diaporthe ilicicola]